MFFGKSNKFKSDLILDAKQLKDDDLEGCKDSTNPGQQLRPLVILLLFFFILVSTLSSWRYRLTDSLQQEQQTSHHSRRATFLSCSIKVLNRSPLDQPLVEEIPAIEFHERRNKVANALYEEGVDAFIIEPGFAEVYYANLSSFDWESWEPEERPFLLVVQPSHSPEGGIAANTTMLVPAFEEARARQLQLPLDEDTTWLRWEEHENPFQVLANYLSSSTTPSQQPPKAILGDEIRLFIAQGLSNSDLQILPYDYSSEVALVPQRKSPREIALLRAVNTLTVNAIRAARICAYDGVSELEFSQVLDDTMRSAGLEPFFDLVLFGENAACPHCSSNGSRKLEASKEMILVDVGAHLHRYSSDVARTFYLPKHGGSDSDRERKTRVWEIVLEAQTAAMDRLHDGRMASEVDIAARSVIEKAGYGEYFTHRLGHGIGIKAHEPPYLNQGNSKTPLRAGMIFTAEPGIYVPGNFGIRHEDIFLVKEDGPPELLSGKRAVSPSEP